MFKQPRLSTTLTLALLIGVLAVGGQWVSQRVSSDVLQETVRLREIDKVNTLGRMIEGLIRQQGEQATLVAGLVSANQLVADSMRLDGAQRRARLAVNLDQAFANGGVKVLEVTDADEIVVYRSQQPQQFGDAATAWAWPRRWPGPRRW